VSAPAEGGPATAVIGLTIGTPDLNLSSQEQRAVEAWLRPQEWRETLGNTDHLGFHLRRKPDVRYPRLHFLSLRQGQQFLIKY
jgi:hypothetical protein